MSCELLFLNMFTHSTIYSQLAELSSLLYFDKVRTPKSKPTGYHFFLKKKKKERTIYEEPGDVEYRYTLPATTENVFVTSFYVDPFYHILFSIILYEKAR